MQALQVIYENQADKSLSFDEWVEYLSGKFGMSVSDLEFNAIVYCGGYYTEQETK